MEYDFDGLIVDHLPVRIENWVASYAIDEFDAEELIGFKIDGAFLHDVERQDLFVEEIGCAIEQFVECIVEVSERELEIADTFLLSLMCFICGLITGKADDIGIDLKTELKFSFVNIAPMHYAVVAEFPKEVAIHLPDEILVIELKRVLN